MTRSGGQKAVWAIGDGKQWAAGVLNWHKDQAAARGRTPPVKKSTSASENQLELRARSLDEKKVSRVRPCPSIRDALRAGGSDSLADASGSCARASPP